MLPEARNLNLLIVLKEKKIGPGDYTKRSTCSYTVRIPRKS